MVIIPGIHSIPLGFVNAFLIEEPGQLALIDTGIPGSHGKIAAYIEGMGRKVRDIKTILITHSDMDHIGSLSALKKTSGAAVCASGTEAAAIQAGKPSRRTKSRGIGGLVRRILLSTVIRPKPVTVDRVLKDGDELPIAGGLAVMETFGHTPGHLSYYLKTPRVLFCGDSMNFKDGGLASSRPEYTSDAAQAAESRKRQADLKPAVICFGHGPAVKF